MNKPAAWETNQPGKGQGRPHAKVGTSQSGDTVWISWKAFHVLSGFKFFKAWVGLAPRSCDSLQGVGLWCLGSSWPQLSVLPQILPASDKKPDRYLQMYTYGSWQAGHTHRDLMVP